MPKLKIFAFQTGEQFITAAALIADKKTMVTVYPGVEQCYGTWEMEARQRKANVLDMFSRKYGKVFRNSEEVKAHLRGVLNKKADEMAHFLMSFLGSDGDRQRVLVDKTSAHVDGNVRGSTDAAVQPYLADADEARGNLRDAVANSLTADMLRQVMAFYEKQKFGQGERYALLWGRTSGLSNAAAPHLDTNGVMVAQMMVAIRRLEPRRKLVLIGDRIEIPNRVGDEIVPNADKDLFYYWTKSEWPRGAGLLEQMYFLALIQSHNPMTVSVGTNSGILELPHLMGMRTIYLENVHDHVRKGLRWWKKQPIHDIQRLSTTSSTTLWGRKHALLYEVRDWLRSAPKHYRISERRSSQAQGHFFSELHKLLKMDGKEARNPNQSSPFARRLATVQEEWTRVKNQPCLEDEIARQRLLNAIEQNAQADKLADNELANFEEFWLEASRDRWNGVMVEQVREPRPVAPAAPIDLAPPPNA